ncbi:hypothetical protein Z968_09940 [Clostridium novyi A str. 4552]|uniref:DUF3298/DUF4163 domain-containing protein n=1 Tax=Clostridium novyi A str. 4552 TaxID=1444289 RepID=A0A0A0I389_CLONO|nr:DUF3298 and DUF4163 domain-containing protein [Clostridium novyi]KGM95113.1 hypothetical protein Z968_09940 [Clostridium novyi A str. 4552]
MNNFIFTGLIISLLSSIAPYAISSSKYITQIEKSHLQSNLFRSRVKVVSKESQTKKDYFESNLKYPVITGLKNKEIEKQINSMIENDVITFRDRLLEAAKKNKDKSIKENYEFLPYLAYTNFKVFTLNDDFVSFYIDYYEFTGGAHGSTFRKSYNIDLKTGKVLNLHDVLKDIPNYKETINKYIYDEISQKPEVYFIDSFKGIYGDISFNLDEKNLIIYFQQYEIAPYSSGIIQFKIPILSLSSF